MLAEAYKKFNKANGQVSREFVDYRELPEGSVKVFETVTNKEVSLSSFTISTLPADTLRFYAQVGSMKSRAKKVALRPIPDIPAAAIQ